MIYIIISFLCLSYISWDNYNLSENTNLNSSRSSLGLSTYASTEECLIILSSLRLKSGKEIPGFFISSPCTISKRELQIRIETYKGSNINLSNENNNSNNLTIKRIEEHIKAIKKEKDIRFFPELSADIVSLKRVKPDIILASKSELNHKIISFLMDINPKDVPTEGSVPVFIRKPLIKQEKTTTSAPL